MWLNIFNYISEMPKDVMYTLVMKIMTTLILLIYGSWSLGSATYIREKHQIIIDLFGMLGTPKSTLAILAQSQEDVVFWTRLIPIFATIILLYAVWAL